MKSPWAICAERGPWQGKGNKCLRRSKERAAGLAKACAMIGTARVFPVGMWFVANREVLRASDLVRKCAVRAGEAVEACNGPVGARLAHRWFNQACWALAQVVDPEAKRLLEKAFILGQQKVL